MAMLTPLPIDPELPRIVAALAGAPGLVLVAEPGAGKTTRVPRALLDAGLAERGGIVVLEPRRLAARLAARRVAEELGEPVGRRIGYQVRFEDRTGPATRVRFVTEGILARRLAADPRLDGTGVVILDEFHERGLDGDLALALLRRLQRTTRPDLQVIVMSATLDAEPVASYLGVPVIRVAGRAHPVTIEHAERPDDRRLEQRVASAVRASLSAERSGHVLVFLPGAAEIRRASEALADVAAEQGIVLAPLHGDLSAEDQDRAVRPSDARKVILATNVAETSITIEGVTAVVDSGLHRRAGHSPWTGLPTLETVPISQASAEQRAGRAGRTGPGRCVRLYTRHDHDTRPAFDPPEIVRSDLAEIVLLFAVLFPGEEAPVEWLNAPPPAALAAARELLVRLGAIDGNGRATDEGRAMLRLPVHPRAARLVLAAATAGIADRGPLLAALAGERDVRRAGRVSFDREAPRVARGHGGSDLLDACTAIEAAEAEGASPSALRRYDLDAAAAQRVLFARDQLRREAARAGVVSTATAADPDTAAMQAILAAFPDRVGRARAPGSNTYVFVGGGSGTLAPHSVANGAAFLVATGAREQPGKGVVIEAASAIEPDWLLDLDAARVTESAEVLFDRAAERALVVTRMSWDGLVLAESRRQDVASPEVARALFEAARDAGPAAWCDAEALARWQQRVGYAHRCDGTVPLHDDAFVLAVLEQLCDGRRSFRELREADLLAHLAASLDRDARARLDRLAPEWVKLPRGRRLTIHYEPGQPPWAGSYLQDFIGMETGPVVGDGEAVVLHLWAPSRRPVQVTTDLASFWRTHYPKLRTQLMRRYPRHEWPPE